MSLGEFPIALSEAAGYNSSLRKVNNNTNNFKGYLKDNTTSTSKAKSMDLQIPPRVSTKYLYGSRRKYVLNVSAIIGILAFILVAFCSITAKFTGADLQDCHSIYMYPSYARINGFDERYTKLAHKYHLYLYREQGLDKEPINGDKVELDGIPVLFIPGNAGSFKQVRSIAAEASNLFFESNYQIQNVHAKNLDVFAADFNEDFTAFHGRTLLDQAEYLNDAIRYILELYENIPSDGNPVPTSVIIVGHSMGGIVARVMPTLDNYIKDSITSMLTLSSPHAAAPLTFDGDIMKIYKEIDDYWIHQFSDPDSYFSKHLSLISITGGISDTILPADYVTIDTLLPATNGFTTFTSNIPNVWTPIDHLAIVWCDQLRKVLARYLLETTNTNSPSKVKSLDERMTIARELFLSGFESYGFQKNRLQTKNTKYTSFDQVSFTKARKVEDNEIVTITKDELSLLEFFRLEIPTDEDDDTYQFNLLSSLPNVEVKFCMDHSKKKLADPDDKSLVYFDCVDSSDVMNVVPNVSKNTTKASDSSFDSDYQPFTMMSFSDNQLSKFDFILVEAPPKKQMSDNSFVTFSLQFDDFATTTDHSAFHTSVFGFKEFVPSENLVHIYEYPNLFNSIFSYKIRASIDCDPPSFLPFEPFMLQWVASPLESKWHLNIVNNDVPINFHSRAPFIPYSSDIAPSLHISVFTPAEVDLNLYWEVDWPLTLKMLFIRYRLAIATFPCFFLSLFIAFQFYYYNKTGFFPAFDLVIDMVLRRYGITISVLLVCLSPLVNTLWVQNILYFLDPLKLTRPLLQIPYHVHMSSYYLGLAELYPSLLGLLFGFITIGLLLIIYKLFCGLEYLIGKLRKIRLVGKMFRPKIPFHLLKRNKFVGKYRLCSSFILIMLVLFYMPFQLAFVVMTVVQLGVCIRLTLYHEIEQTKEYTNLRNYNFSIMILSLFISAINFPVIIVFMHNVAIKWETPFHANHNVLAVLPIILLITANSEFRIPRFSTNSFTDGGITVSLFAYLSFFSLIYGMRNTYWIHYFFNITCIWLLYGIFIRANRVNEF